MGFGIGKTEVITQKVRVGETRRRDYMRIRQNATWDERNILDKHVLDKKKRKTKSLAEQLK